MRQHVPHANNINKNIHEQCVHPEHDEREYEKESKLLVHAVRPVVSEGPEFLKHITHDHPHAERNNRGSQIP